MVEFSVAIAVYNKQDYIGKTLESVLNQTYRNFEVIIVNNASTDHTAAVATEFEATYPHFRMVTEKKVVLMPLV